MNKAEQIKYSKRKQPDLRKHHLFSLENYRIILVLVPEFRINKWKDQCYDNYAC